MKSMTVETDSRASEEEVHAVAAAFAESGLTVDVERRPMGAGAAGPDGWLIIAVLSGFFAAAGEVAFKQLVHLVRRLAESRGGAPDSYGTLIISDERGGDVAISITERRMPPEAWDQLDSVEVVRDRRYYWDHKAGQWRSLDPFDPNPEGVRIAEWTPPRWHELRPEPEAEPQRGWLRRLLRR